MSLDLTSLVLAIATAVLAAATIVLTWETRRMREVQSEPDVFVQLEPEPGNIPDIYLVIGNIGQGAAYNIKFDINPDYEYQKGKLLSELSYINDGISYLARNQIIKSHLIWLHANNRLPFEKLYTPFNIVVKYENKRGKKYTRIYPIDLGQFKDLTSVSLPSIPKNIEKIEEHLKVIADKLKE